MDITNNTRLNFVSTKIADHFYLLIEVVYDIGKEVSINKSLSYGRVFSKEFESCHLPHETLLYVHELNDKEIREYRAYHQDKEYKPTNAQKLMEFMKDFMCIKKFDPQTIAKFRLPSFVLDNTFHLGLVNTPLTKIKVNPVPWNVVETFNYRRRDLSPLIHSFNYYPLKKQLSALLFYPINPEAFITITLGEFHVTE